MSHRKPSPLKRIIAGLVVFVLSAQQTGAQFFAPMAAAANSSAAAYRALPRHSASPYALPARLPARPAAGQDTRLAERGIKESAAPVAALAGRFYAAWQNQALAFSLGLFRRLYAAVRFLNTTSARSTPVPSARRSNFFNPPAAPSPALSRDRFESLPTELRPALERMLVVAAPGMRGERKDSRDIGRNGTGPRAEAEGAAAPRRAQRPAQAFEKPRLARIASLNEWTEREEGANGRLGRIGISKKTEVWMTHYGPKDSLLQRAQAGLGFFAQAVQRYAQGNPARPMSLEKAGDSFEVPGIKVSLRSVDQAQPYGRRRTYDINVAGQNYEMQASPLVFDLDDDGIETSRRAVRFDLDGDGSLDELSDIRSGDGLLVFDADGDGVSGENGLELFGDRSDIDGDGEADGRKDGFKALRALAKRAVREKVLPAEALADDRLEAAELLLLEDAYGLKMKVGGLDRSARTLDAAGVAAIALASGDAERISDFDGRGNDLSVQRGAEFTRKDGSVGSYEDIWFKLRPAGDPARAAS